ncbi:MAG: thiamine-phosphate pyrophosphorylase [Salibacteraceae bacterium]|jgi:thiamine-phosphate pyrophosphorylase
MPFEVAVFSPEKDYPNELELVLDLFKAGLKRFHLRKPHSDLTSIRNYLSSIPKAYRERVFVHYNRKLAEEFGCKLHLQFKFAVIQGEVKQCDSVSVHSLEEFEQIDGHIESCTLSPIFESISKENYAANPTLDGIPRKRETAILALGGVDAHTIIKSIELGFNGAACLGAIWHSKGEPLENFQKIQSVIQLEIVE